MVKSIRISGVITDDDSKELRQMRARLLYHLFMEGYNIYNGNGDQDIHLWNIQRKIKEAHGFVFMPGSNIDDVVKATSIFVGYQTGDMDLNGKPTVMLNNDNSWTPWLEIIEHLQKNGTVSQHYRDVIKIVEQPREVIYALQKQKTMIEKVRTLHDHKPEPSIPGDPERSEPRKKVCVFCSASTKNPSYLKMGYDLGTDIAKAGYGCVTGAGRTGIMGEVVRGGYEAGGWTGGSNVPHIIEMEGLPDGLNAFWPRSDIYTRMEIMIQKSHAFVILPGGMGTVQELLVLLQLKQKNDPLMAGKPIMCVNPKLPDGGTFWDPLIKLAQSFGLHDIMHVSNNVDGLVKEVKRLKAAEKKSAED